MIVWTLCDHSAHVGLSCSGITASYNMGRERPCGSRSPVRGLCYCVTCVCSAAVRASCSCCGRPCRAANLAALCSLSRRHSTSTALCCGTCTPLRVTFIPTLTHWPYRCIYVCFSERRKHLCMPLRLHSLSQHARWRLTREDAGSVMLSSFPYEDRV